MTAGRDRHSSLPIRRHGKSSFLTSFPAAQRRGRCPALRGGCNSHPAGLAEPVIGSLASSGQGKPGASPGVERPGARRKTRWRQETGRWHPGKTGRGGRTARATGVVSRLSEGCEFETTRKINRRNGARGAQRRHEPPVGGSNPSSCT